ncbi:hypothetical protein [Phenylobacterium sp. SCN 70-31]|uniref:hypothetical protein n=1 Tax=Phenylobacterium sp. SCN 70-31 TaxID=1660129 RepID=UPI00086CE1E3|nr:hypothetical protein [Phenylobacterium sp. SCN 70-31]ODT84837.1 MAG: hypothetical protein ABS78_22025 [Phenylobacterium sp. SCN 70-31]
MAADTLQNINGTRVGHVMKIARRWDGTLVSGAGHATYLYDLRQWADLPKKKRKIGPPLPSKDQENSMGVMIEPDGKIYVLQETGICLSGAEYYAIGSGSEFALGAMAMGASAEEAVRAAIKHDCYSGGEINTISHK